MAPGPPGEKPRRGFKTMATDGSLTAASRPAKIDQEITSAAYQLPATVVRVETGRKITITFHARTRQLACLFGAQALSVLRVGMPFAQCRRGFVLISGETQRHE
jgi:hypothetical protein